VGDWGPGIGFGYSVNGAQTNFTIVGNRIIYNGPDDSRTDIFGGYGIMSGTSDAAIPLINFNISRNNISGNHSSGVVFASDSTLKGSWQSGVISDNIIANNGHLAVTPDNCSSNCFNGYAVWLYLNDPSISSFSFFNNVVANNGGSKAGLNLQYWAGFSGAVAVQNNIFYNNGQAQYFDGDIYLPNTTSLTNLTESNNLFARIGTGWQSAPVINYGGTTYDITHVVGTTSGFWQHDSGKDQNSKVGDPLFVSTSIPDFHLRSNSPCIKAGTSVGLTSDYAGNPVSSVPDIGAYEFLGSILPPTGLRLIDE
jgi:hypothetical protein